MKENYRVQIIMPEKNYKGMNALIESGKYSSQSEVIITAIEQMLKNEKDIMRKIRKKDFCHPDYSVQTINEGKEIWYSMFE